MLTRQQAEILEYLSSQPGYTVLYDLLLSRFGSDAALRISGLIENNLVHRLSGYSRPIRLTHKGQTELDFYLASLDRARQQRTDEEAEKAAEKEESRAYQAKQDRKNRHHDYFVAIFEVFLGYLIGVLTQAEFDVAGFFIEFFEKISSLFH